MLWKRADWNAVQAVGQHVHFGCGENVLPGFINMDMLPNDERVTPCNLLDIWPERLVSATEGFYSEDVVEHFFLGEQLYLLCSMNLLSRQGSTSRILMPDIDRLWTYRTSFDFENMQRDSEFFVATMGCTDAIQVINTGMRMGGHRWLHNRESFQNLARLAGFNPLPARCDTSLDPLYNGINLRSEHAIAFATDLLKTHTIQRLIINPARVAGAEQVEVIDADQSLWVSTCDDPIIVYEFPEIPWERICLINVRCANISEFNEHNFSKMYFALDEACSTYTDRTLHTASYMNTFTRVEIERKRPKQSTGVSFLRFDPSERSGDYFTVGPVEIFTLT